jgi:VanZ family protein
MRTDRRTLLAWAGTALLLALCLMPKAWINTLMPEAWITTRSTESPRRFPHLDKVIHFTMFAGFGFLWTRAARSPMRSRAARVLTAAIALAVGTELAQGLPQIARDPDVFDALADTVGAATGVGVVALGVRVRDGQRC